MTSSGKVDARRHRLGFDKATNNVLAYDPFGRPGGGAPLVTEDGKVVSVIARDPQIRFQDQLKKEVENTMVRQFFEREREGREVYHTESACVCFLVCAIL